MSCVENVTLRITGIPEGRTAFASLNISRLILTIVTRLVYSFESCTDNILVGRERNQMDNAIQDDLDFIAVDFMLEMKKESNYDNFIDSNVEYWKKRRKNKFSTVV